MVSDVSGTQSGVLCMWSAMRPPDDLNVPLSSVGLSEATGTPTARSAFGQSNKDSQSLLNQLGAASTTALLK